MRERVQKLYDILQAGEYKTCRSQELIEDDEITEVMINGMPVC